MSARSKFKMSSFWYGVIISCFCREAIQVYQTSRNITAYAIGYNVSCLWLQDGSKLKHLDLQDGSKLKHLDLVQKN